MEKVVLNKTCMRRPAPAIAMFAFRILFAPVRALRIFAEIGSLSVTVLKREAWRQVLRMFGYEISERAVLRSMCGRH
jgi:hypothetical protein